MSRAKDVLLVQLQATHATLQAAVVQVGAQILALQAEDDDSDRQEKPPQCPKCGRIENVLLAGVDGGKPLYVCECGNNFSKEDV